MAEMSDFGYLWRNRERPPSIERRIKVWTKRLYHSVGLAGILLRGARLRRRGAELGQLVVLGEAKIDGTPSRLRISDETALGRCEIALHDDVTIGRRVVINDGVLVLTASHHLDDPHWRLKPSPIRIGDYAWIAQNAVLLPGVTIGKGAVVGAGAVVRCDVPDYGLAIGNPAVIKPGRRTTQLDYSPVRMMAPLEAWLGPLEGIASALTPAEDLGARDLSKRVDDSQKKAAE